MPFNGKADSRKGLPPPFVACGCRDCLNDHEKVRNMIVKRQHRLNPAIKDCRLKISFKWVTPPTTTTHGFPSAISKRSLLRFPDETLLRIFQFTQSIPTTICLALTCKRLCGIYLDDILNHRSAKRENSLWSNTNGVWKSAMIQHLIKGWIPSDRIRFCWGCWVFQPYGEASRDFWHAKFPILAVEEERQSLKAEGNQSSRFCRAEACGAGADSVAFLTPRFPEGTFEAKMHDRFLPRFQALEGLMRTRPLTLLRVEMHRRGGSGFRCEYQMLRFLPEVYRDNWEVQFWLGKPDIHAVGTSLQKDQRIRCPRCVLTNNPLRFLDQGMKLVWPEGQPDLPGVLHLTLGQRASLQGYKWDRNLGLYSMDRTKALTGSYRDRQKKARQAERNRLQ